MTREMLKFNTV